MGHPQSNPALRNGQSAVGTRLICSLTCETLADMRKAMFAARDAGADAVECRLDYLREPPSATDLAHLLDEAPLEVIVTNRPVDQGGRFSGDQDDRTATLAAAAEAGADFVDVEMSVDPADRPEAPTILSHHDFDRVPPDLDAIAARMDAAPAAVNKIAFASAGPEDAFRAFDVIRACRKPTIALAMGEAGLASRILAGKFGAFGTFASLQRGAESAPGQPALDAFGGLYRWRDVGADTALCGVIGCPVGHSMSPAIHNAAFTAADVDAVYVPLLIAPGADNFNRFMDALLARPWLGWRGLSVTIPHKEHALAYVGEANCDPLAVRIGAVNTITVAPDGSLRGDNTDYAAAVDALCDCMGIVRADLAGRRVAVLGAGGAARAIVAALVHYGAEVTVYNRTVSRGEQLAAEFPCRAAGRDALASLDAEIVINCTPIGMHPHVEASPLESIPPSVKVVFDTIYNPIETRLLAAARDACARTVSGLDMFVNQAVAQFEIWYPETPAPRDVMRQIVADRLNP